MKVGIDLHGCIDLYPQFFSKLSHALISNGHSVSIITGQEWEKVGPKVDQLGISYNNHFSIVDYHKVIKTDMWQDSKKTWWMAEKIWLRSKGNYIFSEHVDVHFDDSYAYAEYVPDFCTFILVPKKNFDMLNVLALLIMPSETYKTKEI